MEKQLELCQELSELNPIVGKWTMIGSFKDNPNKHVEGWETYTVENKGSDKLTKITIQGARYPEELERRTDR